MICAASTRTSAWAWSAETPGARRPIIAIVFPHRLVSGVNGNGKNRSKWLPGAKTEPKSNEAGSTPTTVYGRLFSVSDVPTIAGSEANRRCHRPVAEDDRHGTVPGSLLGIEAPAERRLDAEDLEEIAADRHATEALGLPLAAQQVVANTIEREVAGHPRERPGTITQIHHVPDLRRLPRETAGVAVGDPHQPGRLGKRQRTEQQRIDDAEDGGTGADAEPGDEHDEDGEPGVAPERAEGVAQVLKKRVESHVIYRFDGRAGPIGLVSDRHVNPVVSWRAGEPGRRRSGYGRQRVSASA